MLRLAGIHRRTGGFDHAIGHIECIALNVGVGGAFSLSARLPQHILVLARTWSVPLWSSVRRSGRYVKDFRFADMPDREIMRDLEPSNHIIRFGTDPMLLLPSEGNLDGIGPFDTGQPDGYGLMDRIKRQIGTRARLPIWRI